MLVEKGKYCSPEVEVIKVDEIDIILTSGPNDKETPDPMEYWA